ncbi:thiamine biosynthesis protein ThiS [Desulfuribacillus stibiiarsenatis]|uniref:Thiamine biosynthesis protein ThiS n=1 Tax=Desulfuribacillus stibiiarsenatis TaxID=1390249 RepID=A0A1E5L883_9FIRM|nr:sulfur carrier protein ThiS [Desulfuribacillus stibiiarsenatis]OEH86199.1 thiamine biosynthesis protein ThiS [Desulfuribacillus stibiiarsenatis]
MKVTINGKEEQLTVEGLSILEWVVEKGLQPQQLVIEHNGQVIEQEQWSHITLKENDQLEVLRFVGGG